VHEVFVPAAMQAVKGPLGAPYTLSSLGVWRKLDGFAVYTSTTGVLMGVEPVFKYPDMPRYPPQG